MESIKEIYRIGHGPSSSHTMGPRLAAERFLAQNDQAARFVCTLYGSLAATGKGHLTDAVINEVFAKHQLEIIWEPTVFLPHHPNALKLESFSNQGQLLCSKVTYSVGGGAIVEEGESVRKEQIYPYSTMDSILDWCHENGKQLWEYVEESEGSGIWEFLHEIWTVMKESIKRGQEREGTLPGELRLPRKAYAFKLKAENFSGPFKKRSELFSFALAVSEENAAGGLIVTAPTCGACGVVPAVLRYFNKTYKSDEKHVLKALATAGLIGTLVKTNASISGAEVGCQGEVGTACAMASAAATQLMGGTINQIEYSAEMGLEHHLGLTCDPVAGLVQIPCIERNAMAAERALAHNTYALMSDGRHRISFDEVVDTMYQTGKDLPNTYKETSQGGLARYQAKGKR
ncbi:L-serine ammonia-lyase [Mangrovibacterium marinum]|uniref:L-serine ammonia-lyase n=1 Tax=Mangrovibacterium marinum TaxID=1639118 RepID=UPI002A18BFEB|nr:L-serine ammonia-lyase [Mangrovibacterium marinum]